MIDLGYIFSVGCFYPECLIDAIRVTSHMPRLTPTEATQSRSSDFVQFKICCRSKSFKNFDASRLKKKLFDCTDI